MPIGPTLPPHLAKRSRDDDGDRAPSPDASEKRRRVAGPAPPPSASRTAGPTLPPNFPSRSSSEDSDAGPAPPQPPKRVAGPAPPPAPLDQRPSNPPDDDSDSSSDDDFGPAPPPPAGASYASHNDNGRPAPSLFDTDPAYTEAPKKTARDEWMTMPPTQDDLAARMDPTKLRARKFNTGKSAGASSGGGMSSAWTETPEQKLKRLQDEAMGIITPSNAASTSHQSSKKSRDEERRARKIQEKIEATRGKSLVEQHKEKGTGKVKEDDPSKRAFDYEKDMAVIGTVNHKQRRDMLNKSKGFGDRFSGGSFL
ncbi:hypothetical protein P153DRAFT_363810 [Dothidotthia symphoricarpi CBS 119687]|uniref:DUF3752 domain-containing protein n=1 Tax=Dothidotthia symphoricarpi CBS 119687 TaxID=1392245 RepID=A0A6A6AMX2_9PLEO|nr:uncharacterized protein P153DRAFT_363810 [Dothidotthia symphoricarpi CBS 119687]KAF2132488.1 hypothetical protein P153DRAFT_363810 [Dothidotthia symphoricarpi CBS 119687]